MIRTGPDWRVATNGTLVSGGVYEGETRDMPRAAPTWKPAKAFEPDGKLNGPAQLALRKQAVGTRGAMLAALVDVDPNGAAALFAWAHSGLYLEYSHLAKELSAYVR